MGIWNVLFRSRVIELNIFKSWGKEVAKVKAKAKRKKPIFNSDFGMTAINRSREIAQQEILNKVYPLSVEFDSVEGQKIINQFYSDFGFSSGQDGIFVPEYVVLKAHNYGDLIIAIKMQQARSVKQWAIEVESYLYNPDTDEFRIIHYEKELNGCDYHEIFYDLPIKIDRGLGIKTRWTGLEAEIDKDYDNYDLDGFYLSSRRYYIVGGFKFLTINLYNEFRFLQRLREQNRLEEALSLIMDDLVKSGMVNHSMQPTYGSNTVLPVNMLNYLHDNHFDKFNKSDFAGLI